MGRRERGRYFACTCEKADDLNVIEKMEMSGPKSHQKPSEWGIDIKEEEVVVVVEGSIDQR